jgi:hypothetical protein
MSCIGSITKEKKGLYLNYKMTMGSGQILNTELAKDTQEKIRTKLTKPVIQALTVVVGQM